MANHQLERFLVSENPEMKDALSGPLRDIDREDLVELIIAYGIKPVKVEGDRKQMWFFFVADEIQEFENKYLSNIPILLSIGMYAHGREYWRNAMTLWNSKKRFIDQQNG